jgi:hypothetical protein
MSSRRSCESRDGLGAGNAKLAAEAELDDAMLRGGAEYGGEGKDVPVAALVPLRGGGEILRLFARAAELGAGASLK